MDDQLRQTIRTVVNSQTKLDILYYFYRNPYAWESLGGLARRLHRAAEDIEAALHDLTRSELLLARSGRGGGELVFSYSRNAPAAAGVGRLIEAYEGAERREIMQTVGAEDEQSRLRHVAQQRALDDMRTRFVSMVTQALHTTVTIIKGVLKALQSSKPISDEQVRSLVDRASRQTDRLSSMVENLLVLSGLQTGRQLELYLSEVDLPRVVMEVSERFGGGENDPAVRVNLAAAPAAVGADEYLLGQLLEELINNAVKFSPPYASVQVDVTQEGDDALIVIDDQGMGMSAHQHDRVFDPFYQGQEDSARLTGGLGLGLYMSRKIVESHGGEIWFEPKPPPGMKVCLTLPLAGPQD